MHSCYWYNFEEIKPLDELEQSILEHEKFNYEIKNLSNIKSSKRNFDILLERFTKYVHIL